MKEINSFQDALKKVLCSEQRQKPLPKPKRKKKSAYVSEAMGTSSPTSTTQAGGAGLPPFSRASTDSSGNAVDMRDIGSEEEKLAKAHGRKPYPLETVLDFIAHSGEDLQNAQNMINISLRKNDVSLTPEQKKSLKDAQQTIKTSLGNISRAAKEINSINL